MSEAIAATIRTLLQGRPGTPAARQSRRLPRYGIRAPLTVQPLQDDRPLGKPEQVWLRDISRKGLGFVCRRPLPVGKAFLLKVPDGNDLPPLRCVTKRCAKVADGVFVIGASYVAGSGLVIRLAPGEDSQAGGARGSVVKLLYQWIVG